MQQRRRRLIRALSAAGLCGSTGNLLGTLQQALAAENTRFPQGLLTLKGQVTINGAAAHPGQSIKPGDTVTTGPDGEATYVIGQDAFLQRSSSTVDFGKAATDFMRVVTGRILSVFGRGERQISFSTAVIGIRGTACYIETGAAQRKVGLDGTARERAYFCLCYGEAELTPTAAPDQREIVRTTYHDHPLYISDDMQMPSTMVSAPVINHTDAELILLESLVGRLPPFYGRDDLNY